MQYICHTRFDKKDLTGHKRLIRRKEVLDQVSDFIAIGPVAICATTSEDAHMYFARNDDNRGLERGKLTYQIAYAPRHPNDDNGFRFTESEIDLLESKYRHFLRTDADTILFNHKFFNAEVEELEELLAELEAIEK